MSQINILEILSKKKNLRDDDMMLHPLNMGRGSYE